MLDFIIFLLSTFGLTMIVTNSYIFKGFRKFICSKSEFFGKLFTCTMCMGFWSAIIVYYLMMFDIYFILYGFIGSIICYAGYLLLKPYIDKYD